MADGGSAVGGPAPVPMATTLFRCPLCRRSALSGRRNHLYSAGHQRRVREALARLGEKVGAARKTLQAAAVVPFEAGEHERRFWCLCCQREVEQHLSHGALAVLHSGLLQHLASPEHAKAVSVFWWENKADPSLKPHFLLSPADYELFKVSLTKALDAYEAREDEVIQEVAAHIREVEQSRQEMIQTLLEELVESLPPKDLVQKNITAVFWNKYLFFLNQTQPQTQSELCDGHAAVNTLTGGLSDSTSATEEQELPGPSRSTAFVGEQPELDWLEAGQPLTFIGHQETAEKGNIHTGAKPPWLMEEESQGQIGPSYEEFLREKEKQKLKKLPPDRVGANFDHTSQTGEGWLPSFGRVWNHGRRWQSRHQFKAEAGQKKSRTRWKRPQTESI